MIDIARLGLAIDSSQAAQAATALDRFHASANAAAKASDSMSAAAKGAAPSTAAVSKAADAAAKSMDNVAKSTGLTRSEIINLSRQIQDVGVSLVSGQSPFMVLAQQGAQIADIFGSSKTGTVGGAFKQVIGGIGSVLTPVRLLAAGFAGLALGAALTIKSLIDTGKLFDDVSRSVGTTTGVLHGFQQAASFKGIGQEDFLKAMQEFGKSTYDARNNIGGLADVMRANGKSAKDFTGYMETAADLIKNASSDQARLALLQQMGLPATMEWVRFLSQGKDGLRAAIAETANFNESAEGKLVAAARRFDDAWNKATTSFVNNMKSGALEVAGALQSIQVPDWLKRALVSGALGSAFGPVGAAASYFLNRPGPSPLLTNSGTRLNGNSDVSGFYAGLGTGAPGGTKGTTVDPQALQRQISLEQQRLALLGSTATAEEAALTIQKQADAARLQGVAVDQKRIDILKQIARETAIGVTSIKAQADAETVAAGAVGMSVGQATAYTAAQNALNEAKRRGQMLTADEVASIQANADALGRAAERTDQLRFGYENLVKGPLQTFISNLRQGKSAWESFKAAGNSALDAIANKLAEMAAQQLWKSAFGGTSGGIFGSLFSGGAEPGALVALAHSGRGPGEIPSTRTVSPAVFANAPRFHTGIGGGEMAAIIRKDESVLTPGQMRQLAPVGRGGGVTIGDTNVIVQGNADNRAIDAISRELSAHRQAIAGIVAGRQSDARFQMTGVR